MREDCGKIWQKIYYVILKKEKVSKPFKIGNSFELRETTDKKTDKSKGRLGKIEPQNMRTTALGPGYIELGRLELRD